MTGKEKKDKWRLDLLNESSMEVVWDFLREHAYLLEEPKKLKQDTVKSWQLHFIDGTILDCYLKGDEDNSKVEHKEAEENEKNHWKRLVDLLKWKAYYTREIAGLKASNREEKLAELTVKIDQLVKEIDKQRQN